MPCPCCGGSAVCRRCVIGGVWKWEYTTEGACEECDVTHSCYDVESGDTTVVPSCADCMSDMLAGRCLVDGQWRYDLDTEASCEECAAAYCTPDYYSQPYTLVPGCGDCESLYGGTELRCAWWDDSGYRQAAVADCDECYNVYQGSCFVADLYPYRHCYPAGPCGEWHPNTPPALYSCGGWVGCPPGHACIGGQCVTKSCSTTSAGTCGDWAPGPCCRCYQISATGFAVEEGCYILTDLTEHVDALGDWPMFPGGGCVYYRGVYDSAGVLYEFSASLSIPWPDDGAATLTVTLKVGGATVASWTYEKAVSAPWSAPLSFGPGDITSQTGDVCSGGTFEVRPCRCKCEKRGGVTPKSPNQWGFYRGRSRVGGNDTYWTPEVSNGAWTGSWICVDPWTVSGLAAGDVYPMSGPFCDLCGYTPELSGVPGLPLADCICGQGSSSEDCAWAATLETDHYGNRVAVPYMQDGESCSENPFP